MSSRAPLVRTGWPGAVGPCAWGSGKGATGRGWDPPGTHSGSQKHASLPDGPRGFTGAENGAS